MKYLNKYKTYKKEDWDRKVQEVLLKAETDRWKEQLGDDYREKIQEWLKTKKGQKWLKNYNSLKEKIKTGE